MAVMLSACDPLSGYAAAPVDPPTIIGVAPYDTSPGTLDVNVTITEDQDTLTNNSTNIKVTFSTDLIENMNYVQFDDGSEAVICNGVTKNLKGDIQSYSLPGVPRREYICTYRGTKENEDTEIVTQLPFTQMIDVPLKSTLNPLLPTITGSGFTLHYTPDGAGSNCTISATAIDRAGDQQVVGGSLPSTTGTYTGPSTAGLKGRGDIELTRTCKFTPSSPFDSMQVTYITNASVEVTWTT
jgi:hypothetical protein